jgi:hypothetical protein
MELEEAVLILVLGYVAIMGFWLSGLSYLVLKKPQYVGVDGGFEAQTDRINEESLYKDGGELGLLGKLRRKPLRMGNLQKKE